MINIISWIIGALFALFTISFFAEGAIIAGLFSLIATCQTLPVTYKLIHKKTMAAAKEKGIAEKPLKQSVGLTIGFMAFCLAFIIFAVGIEGRKSQPETTVKQQCEDKINAYYYAQQIMNNNLKSPSTAEYPSYTSSGITIEYSGNCTHKVRAFVDSQNSFGAMIRTPFYVELKNDIKNEKWNLIKLEK